MRTLVVFILLLLAFSAQAQPTISFTFDDGVMSDRGGYKFEAWNNMLLNALDAAHVKAVFFVTTNDKSNSRGDYLLQSWNDRGHKIANHTHSHPNFNSTKHNALKFEQELLLADSLISKYSNYTKLFRFPYLKEGKGKAKVDSIRYFMKKHDYKNGYVTIDASDWYVDIRLRKRLKQDQKANMEGFKQFYLQHIYDRAMYYEQLSFDLTGRHIHHTLLLHHNLTSALFLGDLIEMFKAKGWKILSADKAYDDEIYSKAPQHAGESLIWSIAKNSVKYEGELRYPAEDSRYEKERMDQLGL